MTRNIQDIIDQYASATVLTMGRTTLEDYVFNSIVENMSGLEDNEILDIVAEEFPDINIGD